jgi:succinoglycan biosynthesis protein ExoL
VKISYFAHDLNDPAVHRRVRMLQAGGGQVVLIGFCRGEPPTMVEGCRPIVIGRTHDARLLHRMATTAGAMGRVGRLRGAIAGSEVIIARQLEMLVIARLAQWRYARKAILVFECLDIHRLMIDRGWPGRLMRRVEGWLLGDCDLLVVSSPGFVREHFAKSYRRLPRILLAENKVLASEVGAFPPQGPSQPLAGPPWRIGWFGNIRCRRSLLLLAGLTRRFPGLVEVVIRGRPARTAIPDFDLIVTAHPGISFLGPYDRRVDLAAIYGDVHFSWTMDFFEAGGNSEWLLPNRLYEGGLYGVVALASGRVETGRWLQKRDVGVVLTDPLDAALGAYFAGLNPDTYRAARAAVGQLPSAALLDQEWDCRAFVRTLADPGSLGCAGLDPRRAHASLPGEA